MRIEEQAQALRGESRAKRQRPREPPTVCAPDEVPEQRRRHHTGEHVDGERTRLSDERRGEAEQALHVWQRALPGGRAGGAAAGDVRRSHAAEIPQIRDVGLHTGPRQRHQGDGDDPAHCAGCDAPVSCD